VRAGEALWAPQTTFPGALVLCVDRQHCGQRAVAGWLAVRCTAAGRVAVLQLRGRGARASSQSSPSGTGTFGEVLCRPTADGR